MPVRVLQRLFIGPHQSSSELMSSLQARLLQQDQVNNADSAIIFLINHCSVRVGLNGPRGSRGRLQGLRGSRGRPTGSQGVKG